MNKLYQRLILLILLVAGISGTVIYFTVDIHTLKHFDVFKPWTILLVLFVWSVGMFFDGTRLMHLVRISGESISLIQAVQVIFSNYFLALLTPGAAGGAFAQVMFLRKAGVPIGKATVLVIVRTLLSIFFMLVCMPFIFLIESDKLPWLSPNLLLGISIGLLLCMGLGIWLIRTNLLVYLMRPLFKNARHHLRRNAFNLYKDVRGGVLLLAAAPLSMIRVFVESAFSLLALYSMVPALFWGMGISVDLVHVLGKMIFLNLLLYFAPTPGGSGIAEGTFVLLFASDLPAGTVGILAVVWRIFSEYLPFSIGMYFTIRVFGQNFLTREIK
ncbi:MAG: lysylphosphatidylglycerol synthase transmembrane domain-containing protein [Sporomusaceae bacterium]|nr:lysylphosphatidylglycerol synthase transmembrane domain-containing protein [Sporomusaceae bacterium]